MKASPRQLYGATVNLHGRARLRLACKGSCEEITSLSLTSKLLLGAIGRNHTRESFFTLPDGRTLGFYESGDPYGTPVIYIHAVEIRLPIARILLLIYCRYRSQSLGLADGYPTPRVCRGEPSSQLQKASEYVQAGDLMQAVMLPKVEQHSSSKTFVQTLWAFLLCLCGRC